MRDNFTWSTVQARVQLNTFSAVGYTVPFFLSDSTNFLNCKAD